MTLQNVKKIKGATDKKRAKNVTCKQGLSHISYKSVLGQPIVKSSITLIPIPFIMDIFVSAGIALHELNQRVHLTNSCNYLHVHLFVRR